ncbi:MULTISPECIES: Crp/Fnr family transcriptional regulator [unclassified Streptomyces]|uniref:Crp/Fnr family transcriptional regulator n=1 Tax=unclassified Streptomyces TaxID=2593676 RepID=UPI0038068034
MNASRVTPPATRAVLIGPSLYEVDSVTGRTRYRTRRRSVSEIVEHNAFLQRLSPNQRDDLLAAGQLRRYHRKDLLRGSISSLVHVVLSGCVAEEATYGDSTTVRILGTGSVLGDMEICDGSLITPTTRCLNTTLTLAMPMERIRLLSEASPALALAIGASVTERLKNAEKVYNRSALRPEERLAGLFMHLLRTCAVPCKEFGRMLEGPSQQDLADALAVSRATIEGALRELRREELVVTGYRTFQFPSEALLADFGKVRMPTMRVTGESSQR